MKFRYRVDPRSRRKYVEKKGKPMCGMLFFTGNHYQLPCAREKGHRGDCRERGVKPTSGCIDSKRYGIIRKMVVGNGKRQSHYWD